MTMPVNAPGATPGDFSFMNDKFLRFSLNLDYKAIELSGPLLT